MKAQTLYRGDNSKQKEKPTKAEKVYNAIRNQKARIARHTNKPKA